MRFAAGCLIVLAIQWGALPSTSLAGSSVDLPLAFVIYAALHARKPFPGVRLWAFGMALDVLGPHPTGLHGLSFLFLGWIAHSVGGRLDPNSAGVRCGLLLSCSAALKCAQLIALAAEGGSLPCAADCAAHVAASAVWTAAAGWVAFALADRTSLRDRSVSGAGRPAFSGF